jgi:hypothetical protein
MSCYLPSFSDAINVAAALRKLMDDNDTSDDEPDNQEDGTVSRKTSRAFSEQAGGVNDRNLFVIVATHIFHDQIKSSKIKEEMQ